MTDEIASFKVTAADNQKQKVHPSGDVHMQEDSHFIHVVFVCKSILCRFFVFLFPNEP